METPEAMHLMAGLEEAMREDEHVGWTCSLADIMMRTYQVFAPDVATAGLPTDKDLVAQLLFLSESPMLEGFVNRRRSRAVVRAFLTGYNSAVTRGVLRRLEAYLQVNPPDGIRVSLAGGAGPARLALNDYTVSGKVWNLITLVGVMYACASFFLGTATGGAYVVAPLVMTLFVTVGLFAWCGVAFDHAGATVATVGVGLCADYSTYFLYRVREEVAIRGDLRLSLRQALETSGRAVLFVALAMGGGFTVYLASDYYPLWMAGMVLPLMMLIGSLTTLTLLPVMVLLGRPSFVHAEPLQPRERRAGRAIDSGQ